MLRAWVAALRAPRYSPLPVWLHGDLHPAHILVHQGRVSGVIDFGDITSGDPASDLSVAWMLLPPGCHDWPNGYHESAWRVVDDDVRGVLGLPYYADIARIAERGLMDSIFLADNIAIAEYRVTHLPQTQFDPISVLSALAAVTEHIGLIGTGSTTYSKPWELARRFATLDHLSGGRAGWNIVTTVTPLAAANFGEAAHPDHADRYARAHEFVEVVTARLGQLGGRRHHR